MKLLLKVISISALFPVFMALERVRPLRRITVDIGERYVVNGSLAVLAAVTAWTFVKPASTRFLSLTSGLSCDHTAKKCRIGAGRPVATFLLLDFTFYLWHRANHRLPFLWRFHNVHHYDPDLDVTTATRFHFGELLLSAAFRALQILFIRPRYSQYVAYEAFFQVGTWFHHSNIHLPLGLEQLLVKGIVTPRMHGIHHSQVRADAFSNFGTLLTLWDRMCGTLRLNVRQETLTIGVAGYARTSDNTVRVALMAPFRAQRPYWIAEEHPGAEPLAADNVLLP